MAEYITLADSEGTLSKRFLAIGYKKRFARRRAAERRADGLLSVVGGKDQQVFSFVLAVEETPTDGNYGSMAELETLFALSNPGGAPTDVLAMTHLDGTAFDVRFLGDLEWRAEGVLLFGNQAYYRVGVELVDVGVEVLDLGEAAGSYWLAVV